MKDILKVAKNEIIEQKRQPAMLVMMASSYLIWSPLLILGVFAFDTAKENPMMMELLSDHYFNQFGLRNPDKAFNVLFRMLQTALGSVLFTNLVLFVANLSSYSILNDRKHGTLSFLFMTGMRPKTIALGKILGALLIPTLLHFVFIGGTTIAVRQIDVIEPYAAQFGSSVAWWVAFFFGAPLSAFFVGALGTYISAKSHDIRTSVQFSSFGLGFFSLICGFMLFNGISLGAGAQLAYIGGLAISSVILVVLTARSLGRVPG